MDLNWPGLPVAVTVMVRRLTIASGGVGVAWIAAMRIGRTARDRSVRTEEDCLECPYHWIAPLLARNCRWAQ